MIIVSQSKNAIYNFDNTNCIFIRESEEECSIILFDNTYCLEGDGDCIGIYKTGERAKEVLEEIITRYKNWENLKAGQPTGLCSPAYEMPKE